MLQHADYCPGIIYKQFGNGYNFNRLHSVAVLKQFGFGDSRTMELKIQAEAEHLLAYIHAQNESAFNPIDVFLLSSLNVIYEMLFSQRLAFGDPHQIYLKDAIREFIDSSDPIYDVFPLLTRLPAFTKKLNGLGPISETWNHFFDCKLRESLAAEDNFVTQYCKRAGKDYDSKELSHLLRDFIIAGSDSTGTSLAWAVVLLGNHPSVQTRLQAELDAVVPRGRPPAISDRARLPLMEATLLEVLRLRTLAPLAVPHVSVVDTEVAGFRIPADTVVRCASSST